ncbi:hypothetical protein DASC09_063540 [Saccharomycopsis crataegensis]|uniref:Uncharacterized protein n=1 Tax=Saccharomycopsis crataegensis TaxID=43959 RepID=A0AAV5QWJ4_9ASCO|nr:hypothetical protein DASC09_063540 [Saccharomycopsis crataegensis]
MATEYYHEDMASPMSRQYSIFSKLNNNDSLDDLESTFTMDNYKPHGSTNSTKPLAQDNIRGFASRSKLIKISTGDNDFNDLDSSDDELDAVLPRRTRRNLFDDDDDDDKNINNNDNNNNNNENEEKLEKITESSSTVHKSHADYRPPIPEKDTPNNINSQKLKSTPRKLPPNYPPAYTTKGRSPLSHQAYHNKATEDGVGVAGIDSTELINFKPSQIGNVEKPLSSSPFTHGRSSSKTSDLLITPCASTTTTTTTTQDVLNPSLKVITPSTTSNLFDGNHNISRSIYRTLSVASSLTDQQSRGSIGPITTTIIPPPSLVSSLKGSSSSSPSSSSSSSQSSPQKNKKYNKTRLGSLFVSSKELQRQKQMSKYLESQPGTLVDMDISSYNDSQTRNSGTSFNDTDSVYSRRSTNSAAIPFNDTTSVYSKRSTKLFHNPGSHFENYEKYGRKNPSKKLFGRLFG